MGDVNASEVATVLKRPPPRPRTQSNQDSEASSSVSSENGNTTPETARASISCPTCNKGRACGLVVKLTKQMGGIQKKGDVFEAQVLMKKLRSQGHRPSPRTYTTLLATVSRARDPKVRTRKSHSLFLPNDYAHEGPVTSGAPYLRRWIHVISLTLHSQSLPPVVRSVHNVFSNETHTADTFLHRFVGVWEQQTSTGQFQTRQRNVPFG